MITHIWGLEFSVSEAKIQSEAEYYQGEILVGIEDMLQYHDTIKDMQTKRDWIAVTFNDDSTIIITVKPNKLVDDS